MIGDVSQEFSAELMKGMFDTADREGVRLLYLMGMPRHAEPAEPGVVLRSEYHHNSIYDYANLLGADAYIFSCGSLSGFQNEHTFQGFLRHFEARPYVILQDSVEGGLPGKSSITVDNYDSFCDCVEHLIRVHSLARIAFLAGLRDHPDTKERLLAYRDTMAKHALPVSEAMIAYGDFSEYSDRLAAQLIDQNPGLQAIACCNDEMAKGCYRVCAQRGLKIGRDIAITGFDNFSTSRTLMPPLTTISQNIYQMGEMAVVQAISLLEGKRADPIRLKTKFHIRRSCGCYPNTVRNLFADAETGSLLPTDTVMDNITADLVRAYGNSERKRSQILVTRFAEHARALLSHGALLSADKFALTEWLQGLADEYTDETHLLAKRLNDYILQMPNECMTAPGMRDLYDYISFARGCLFSYKASMTEQKLDEFRAQSWFIPELIRDLVDSDLEDENVFLKVVKRLQSINLKSIYICLLPEARPLREVSTLHMPDRVLLAAYSSDNVIRSFALSQMPQISMEDTLCSLPDLRSDTHLMSFSIFSGDVQYGILLCGVDMSMGSLLHVIGLQLGILCNLLELKRKEKIIGDELENIRERNEILNFLYEYDPLCNILNRRGFIERAIRLNRDNIGKLALCVFMDLDHLKEINDTFGHSAGDTALQAVSEILKSAVRSQDLVARVGGDEFIGMIIVDSYEHEEAIRKRLRKAFADFNRTSGLPYYVDASMGIKGFQCDHRLEISTIVNVADECLYEEKKRKRPSAVKDKAQ